MPSALVPLLPSFCKDLFGILSSLSFDCGGTSEDGYLLRLKTGKRSLLFFCALVTRHRKFSDKYACMSSSYTQARAHARIHTHTGRNTCTHGSKNIYVYRYIYVYI